MADFTIRLADLIESGYDVIGTALSDYPAPSEAVRAELNAMLINHYADREIGAESPDMFCFYLKRAMSEIMPYYVLRYEANAKLAGFDPSKTYSEILNTIRDSTGNAQSTSSSASSDDYKQTATTTGSTSGTGDSTDDRTGHSTAIGSNSDNGNTKNYDVPISGSDNGFDSKYVTGGATTGSNGSSSSESNDTEKNVAHSESSSKTQSNGETTNKGSHESNGSGSSSETAHGEEQTQRSGYTSAIWESVEAYRKVLENWTMKIVTNQKVDSCFMQIFNGYSDTYGAPIYYGGIYGY